MPLDLMPMTVHGLIGDRARSREATALVPAPPQLYES